MRFPYPVLSWQHSVLSAASVSVFTFCRVSLPRVAWLKRELLARDCAFWVGLAGRFSGHSWTRSGGCGHLMPCLAGAGELQMTAPVCGRGPLVLGPEQASPQGVSHPLSPVPGFLTWQQECFQKGEGKVARLLEAPDLEHTQCHFAVF